MKTLCYGLSDTRQKLILSGRLKVISFPSNSKTVKYFNEFGLTHLSLPYDKAVSLTFNRTFQKKNNYHNKVMEYTEFTLGEIVEQGDLLHNVKWNDRVYGIGTPVFWKVSKYETKEGARYLIFIGRNFQIGLNKNEFKKLIKEVKE